MYTDSGHLKWTRNRLGGVTKKYIFRKQTFLQELQTDRRHI